MRSGLMFSAVLAAALASGGCRSSDDGGHAPHARRTGDHRTALQRAIVDYKVVWAHGGRLGYVKTYDTRRGHDDPVRLHFVEDLRFREVGWLSNDGLGERYRFHEDTVAAARREPFERVGLPVDTIENNVRRIFGLDPGTEIAILPATEADVRR